MQLAIAATYYRTGLLLGLLRGDEVHRWAEHCIVTVLRQMRSMLRLPPRLYDELNATLVEHARIGVPTSPVPDWLRQFAGRGSSRCRCEQGMYLRRCP
jgi:hypothetical protein